jgi:hypothetical protein
VVGIDSIDEASAAIGHADQIKFLRNENTGDMDPELIIRIHS